MPNSQHPARRVFDPDVDPDSMIFSALSWYSVVHKLEQNLPKWTTESPYLYNGVITASPILLPFAVETALKAWYWRDRKKEPSWKHYLLPLFDDLNPNSINLLEQRMSALQSCIKSQPGVPKNRHKTSLRDLLSLHNDTFIKWRYPTYYKISPLRSLHSGSRSRLSSTLTKKTSPSLKPSSMVTTVRFAGSLPGNIPIAYINCLQQFPFHKTNP